MKAADKQMLIRIALLLIGVPLLAHGGEGLYVAVRSRAQAHLTCEQYFQQRPRSGWVRISGCEVDYVRAGYRESRGRITELLFPVRPAGSSPAIPAALVLATSDPDVLAIAERTIGGPARADQESFLVMMLQIVTAMRASREIDGLARTPLAMMGARSAMESIRAPLADNFAILDLHAKPELLLPSVEVAAGGTALLLLLLLSVKERILKAAAVADASRYADAATSPPPIAGGPATLEPVPNVVRETDVMGAPKFVLVPPGRLDLRRGGELPPPVPLSEPEPVPVVARTEPGSLRGLMLLNVPESATVADIENAPPLGSQDEVRALLDGVLPGLTFDENGRAAHIGPRIRVEVDLASAPVVHTAVLNIEGEDADLAFERLLSHTGWRAFSPRRWTFL